MPEDLNLDQLVEPTPESRNAFGAAVDALVEMGEQYNQVSASSSRWVEAYLGNPRGKTIASVACGVYDRKPAGEQNETKSGLKVSVLHWASKEPDKALHWGQGPARWTVRRGVVEETMDDQTFAFAMQDLETSLPPESMEWVHKAMDQAATPQDAAFEPFAINDLLDQAPSHEELMAKNPHITLDNVYGCAVSVLEKKTKGVQLRCNNGSEVSMFAADANAAYWERESEPIVLSVHVVVADRLAYSYLKFRDGSEQLIARTSDFADRAALRQSGVTLVEETEDTALWDDVRRGVQAPNDITLKMMTAEISAALASGVTEYYMR